MKNKLKVLALTFITLAVVTFLFSSFFDFISDGISGNKTQSLFEGTEELLGAEVGTLFFLVVFAFGFTFSKSKALKMTSLLLISFVVISIFQLQKEVILVLEETSSGSKYKIGGATILLLVSAIMFLAYLIVELIKPIHEFYSLKVSNGVNTVELLAKWKKMYDDNVISDVEFSNIKKELLENVSNKSNDVYSELYMLSDLYKGEYITENEYNDLKKKLIK